MTTLADISYNRRDSTRAVRHWMREDACAASSRDVRPRSITIQLIQPDCECVSEHGRTRTAAHQPRSDGTISWTSAWMRSHQIGDRSRWRIRTEQRRIVRASRSKRPSRPSPAVFRNIRRGRCTCHRSIGRRRRRCGLANHRRTTSAVSHKLSHRSGEIAHAAARSFDGHRG
jgi:hypothetical protein